MRHGEAAPGVPDDLRPLTLSGQAAVAAMAAHADGVTWIAASPLVRAQETATLVQGIFAVPIESWQELVPGGKPQLVYGKLAESSGTGLLVTHQPFVDMFITDLTSTVPRMSPGALARIRGEALLPGYCELVWVKHT